MALPLVEMSGICRTYRLAEGGQVPVLHEITLDILWGEYVALMGASGSGKSTLLNIIGLLDRPDGGSYRLNGIEVSSLSDRQLSLLRGQRIGFVFQSFHLIPTLTVQENVELPLFYQGWSRHRRRRRAAEELERVGLQHRVGHRPNQLSGGERQRTAIARALAMQPALLVADEPTGNLDSAVGHEILDLIDQLHAMGLTVVMVTHDAEVAARSNRVVRMRDGRLAEASQRERPV